MQSDTEIINLESTDLENNIRNRLFLSGIEPITQNLILKIKTLNINKLGYGLKENNFNPEELKLFKNLEICEFTGMEITDEILGALKTLENLKVLSFDYCSNNTTQKIDSKIEKVLILNSNFNFIDILSNKNAIKTMQIQRTPEQVDIERFVSALNLENLCIYNSEIFNAQDLQKFENLKILRLDGSSVDDEKSINNLGIKVNKEENFYFRG